MVEVVHSSELSVNFNVTTRRYILSLYLYLPLFLSIFISCVVILQFNFTSLYNVFENILYVCMLIFFFSVIRKINCCFCIVMVSNVCSFYIPLKEKSVKIYESDFCFHVYSVLKTFLMLVQYPVFVLFI
jgi:hypothetical protein